VGKRGPVGKSAELKKLRGARADRVKSEVASATGRPDKPEWLGRVAAAEWDRMVPLLEQTSVLSRIDGAALALYCVTFERWREAIKATAESGLVEVQGSGAIKPSPFVMIAMTCEKQMRTLLAEFGCSPSARGRVTPVAEAESDPLTDFLAGRETKGT
jgi:P27 family predicted phage terminase small subunit